MPQIHLKQPGQAVADFAVNGAIVTVAGVEVDCAARQLDTSVAIEVRANSGIASEGGNGAYLAQILIPARRYQDVSSVDAEGKDVVLREAIALDPNAVSVTLWPTV